MKQSTLLPYMNPELDAKARAEDLVSRLTLEEKIESMVQYQPAIERLGIRAYKHGTEAAHGMAWLGEATSFPQPIGLGCTWNQELMKEIGSAIGDEARVFYQRNPEVNGLTLWAPTVDMERDPRWGRTEEAYGEDPVLTGELTAALVQGLQGDHPRIFKSVATLKHFIGNNNEINRGSCSASIDPRNMKEYYQAAFKPAFVKGGARSMMTSYNSVNGTPTILLDDVKRVVKEEWGMDGFIVSDAGDLLGIVNDHRYYYTYKEAVAHAIKAGIDSITDDKDKSCAAIREALADGLLAESDLDEALRNTFGVRIRLGEFDPEEQNPYANTPESKLNSPEHSALSRRAATESIVLLKNDRAQDGVKLLPLSRNSTDRIAVIGPLGDVVYRDWYSGTLPYKVTPLDGIRQAAAGRVAYSSGHDIVTLRAEDGRPLVLDHEGAKLCAAEDVSAEPEKFELSDWGWGSHTLRSQSNGKLLSSGDDVHLAANADEAFGWFVKEIVGLTPQECESGGIGLSTWNVKRVSLPDGSGPLTIEEEGEASVKGGLIRKTIVTDGIAEAVQAAKAAETAIVFVGNNPLVNGKEEIDRPGLELPAGQQTLIRAVLEANPRTIVVVLGSYPFALGELAEQVPAILYSSHGGQELGHAISDILFGEQSPAGRLNMTWYTSAERLTDIMDYDIIKGKRTYQYAEEEPLYPFGHGLSYADFSYGDLELTDETTIPMDGSARWAGQVRVAVTVTNVSKRDGDEVVQLYVRAEGSRVRRPVKKLVAFRRMRIAAGASARMEFIVSGEELAIWDVTRDRFVLENGEYVFMAGASSSDIRRRASARLRGGTAIPKRDLTLSTRAENYDDYEAVLLDESKEGGTCVAPASGGSGWIEFRDVDLHKGTDDRAFVGRVRVGPLGGSVSVSMAAQSGAALGGTQLDADGSGEWTDIVIPLAGMLDPQSGGVLRVNIAGDVKLSRFKLEG